MAKKTKRLALPAYHVTWMFNHVQEHFVNEIKNLEQEIMRHERFADQPLLTASYNPDKKTRAERLKEIDRFIKSYRDIIQVTAQVRTELGDLAAQDATIEIHFKKAK